jgi:hypothetical protein
VEAGPCGKKEVKPAPPWVEIALALPGTLLILATAVMLLGLPVGIDPLWRVEPMTLAEAAALRDNGEVVRLIYGGEDPNTRGTVRAELVHNNAQVVTPLEAAVAIDRPDMLQTLLENGAVLDATTWTHLMCFAVSTEADEAIEFLERRRPAEASSVCDDVRTPW